MGWIESKWVRMVLPEQWREQSEHKRRRFHLCSAPDCSHNLLSGCTLLSRALRVTANAIRALRYVRRRNHNETSTTA